MRSEALSTAVDNGLEDRCRRCGGRLAADQEWCLDCGTARTLLRPTPAWRLATAIVLGLLALAVVALVVVLVSVGA